MCGVVARRRPDSDEPLCRSCDTPPLFASGAGERAASEAENASARRRRPGGRGVALESLGPGRDLASRMFNTLMMHYEHFSEIRIFLGKGTERETFFRIPGRCQSRQWNCIFSWSRKGNFEMISQMCLIISAFNLACHAGN